MWWSLLVGGHRGLIRGPIDRRMHTGYNMLDLHGHRVPQTPIFIATFIVAHVQLQNSMVHCRYLSLNILRSSLLLCDKDTHQKFKEYFGILTYRCLKKKHVCVYDTSSNDTECVGASLGKRLESHVHRLQFS